MMLSGICTLSEVPQGTPQVATERLHRSSRTSRGCIDGPTNIKHLDNFTFNRLIISHQI